MPEVHAILSASSSKRWLNCTPSARLEQNFPNESSVYAEEGTAAHALGEYKLRRYLHELVRRPIPVPDYVDENVSDKVVKIIQSYTGVVNKMVWRKY